MDIVMATFCLLALAVIIWSLVSAYRYGRVYYGHAFARWLYADRADQPKLFWAIVVSHIVLFVIFLSNLAQYLMQSIS